MQFVIWPTVPADPKRSRRAGTTTLDGSLKYDYLTIKGFLLKADEPT